MPKRPDEERRDEGAGRTDGPSPTESAAIVRSYVDRTHHAVFAWGELGALHSSYLSHAGGLGEVPDEGLLAIMRRALAAATLQLALWPPDLYSSFTLNIAEPACNVFVAGDNGDFQVTGRIYTENVKVAERNRLIVESQRPKLEPAKSMVDFDGLDVFDAFHAYWKRAIQSRGRLFDLGGDEVLLVQGLPIVDREWWDALDLDAARLSLDSGLEEIETRAYRFACGCDQERMTAVIREMFAASPDELFGDDESAEVQCPRCGRHFTLERSALSQ